MPRGGSIGRDSHGPHARITPCLHHLPRRATPGEPARGPLLHDALCAAAAFGGRPVRLARVTCLANCERGCTAAITTPGKWTYLLGGLDAGHAADLLTYARA